jgi:hypothetical protein
MSEDPESDPEPFPSDFSFSVLTCFVLVTILAISANFVLAVEDKPVLGRVIDVIILGIAVPFSVWQYRGNRRNRRTDIQRVFPRY